MMAPRKPTKSQRGKPNKNLGDVLGGAAKVVGRAAAQNPIVAQNVRYGKAVLAGPTALAKTLVTDLAYGAAGAGVGKAAVGVGKVAAKTGIPARVVNKVTKQEVLLHGRKTAGYSEIKPAGGKYEGLPESQRQYAVAWYDNPQVARDFGLAKSYGFSSPEKLGTVYAVRGKAKTFTQGDYVTPAKFKTDLIVQSSKNQKVVSSVNLTGNTGADDAAIARMLKRAGGTIPPSMRKPRGGGKNKK